MFKFWFCFAFKLGDDALSKHLAQFNAPLVERVKVPDGALREHHMLIERHQLAENFRGKPFGKNHVGWTITLKHTMRHQPFRRAFSSDLLSGLAERQRLGLGENVRHKHIVMLSQRVERVSKRNKVTRDQPRSLMDELIEGMLAVRARLAPVYGAGLVANGAAVERNVLAVALHRQLLQVSGKSLQILLIRKNSDSVCAKEVVVPEADQPHEYGEVLLKWSSAKMLIQLMESVQHGPEMVGTDGQHRGKANRRIHGVAPADPIPEFKHVGRIDPEFSYLCGIG